MRWPVGLLLLCFGFASSAQDLVVYDDALRNGFVGNYSYGGGTDLNHATTTYNGSTRSIAFIGNAFNAVAFPHETVNFNTADYSGVRFYVHGGATGGQQLRFQVFNDLGGAPLANVELDTYISGGAIAANEWRLVEVRFASAPLAFAGMFDRFDLQSDAPGAQPVLYLDDVALIDATPPASVIFSDGFEPGAAGPAGNVRFATAAFAVDEDAGSATISVERINGSFGAASVMYATSNGTATQPGDYGATSGTLMWAAGDATPKSFNVTIVDDGLPETDETVNLALSNATGATLGVPASAALTIVEPELIFVPQYTTNSIRGYRRAAGGFVFVRTAPLGNGVLPNALAFAPDGKLWVVDSGATKRLLRFSTQAILTAPNPAAEVTIGPVGGGQGELFDMAFFGDSAYVTQSNFGATHRVLRYSLAQLAASGNPAATILTAPSLNVPAGLAFDAQGRLWISNYGNSTLVRMNASTGTADRIGTSVALGARNTLNLPEGLSFDEDETLWVGNNGEPTISAYAEWQLNDAAFGATTPVHQIDVNPALFQGDTVGGLAFDREGDLWSNYQKDLTVREYALTPIPRPGGEPGVGSYLSAPGQVLANATTFPGFGGIAVWPVPASMHRSAAAFRGTNVVGMELNYAFYPQASGPVGGTHYPVHDTRLVDYFASKGMTTLRFLFSWEAMQSALMGPIPAADAGDYRLYFDRYKNIVDYATLVKGMQVIVEPWQADAGGGAGGPRWRGGLVGSPAVPLAAWSDFWTKMAGVFVANPRVSFGLVNEPNNMSTLGWWGIAQAGITAIRNAGATQRIFVPGNGYTAASTWVIGDAFYDTDPVRRSNAYGWLNANGPGMPITDPANNLAVEVHTYLDPDEGGSTTAITSVTAARQHLAVVVDEARARGYKVYLGELGFLATVPIAPAAWADFIDYFEANQDVLIGFTWWAGGAPAWWDDIGATGGGHFAITPTDDATFTGDTVNMDMIENDF